MLKRRPIIQSDEKRNLDLSIVDDMENEWYSNTKGKTFASAILKR